MSNRENDRTEEHLSSLWADYRELAEQADELLTLQDERTLTPEEEDRLESLTTDLEELSEQLGDYAEGR